MAKLSVKSFSNLDEAKARYQTEIDGKAEEIRRRYITASPGQSMTYEAKYQEAKRYPEGGSFPFLEREAEALGMSVEAVAESVKVARHRWEYMGSLIEARRLQGKQQVRAATTAAEMHRISKVIFDGLA